MITLNVPASFSIFDSAFLLWYHKEIPSEWGMGQADGDSPNGGCFHGNEGRHGHT